MENEKMDLLRLEKTLFEEIQNAENPLTLLEIKENNNYQPEELEKVKRALMELLENRFIRNCTKFENLASMKFEETFIGNDFFKHLSNEDRFTTAEIICKKLKDFSISTFLKVYSKLEEKEMDEFVDYCYGKAWVLAEDGSYIPKTIFDDAPQK